MIRRFFNQSIVIQRAKLTTGNIRVFQSTATVDGHIQELEQEARQKKGITEEKAWLAWFEEDCNIKEGDRIRDEDNTEYQVREIVKKSYGINRHKEVLLYEQN